MTAKRAADADDASAHDASVRGAPTLGEPASLDHPRPPFGPTEIARVSRIGWWAETKARLGHPGARKWYWGSIWGLIYLVIPIVLIWSNKPPVVAGILMTALIALIAAIYVVTPPLIWGRPWPVAAASYAVFIAITCLGIPMIGENVIWLWIFVPVMSAMSWQPRAFTLLTILVIVIAQLTVIVLTGTFADYWYSVALTASIGVMMFAFAQQIQAVQRLRDAQSEIARLAVVDERERFARDMHDVLGHSLTVVTVKSELARRLVSREPERAEEELADIERLSRAALADLRASVAGYRAMTLETELSAAHAALVAADIVPHLPTSTDVVAPELRETFAWVLRESITNVVRHARAKNCWVALEKRAIIIGDDGIGMPVVAVQSDQRTARGNGVDGMRERAVRVGAEFSIEPGEDGGSVVAVRVATGRGPSARPLRRSGDVS
ncbi:sensor histidine kinase [Planctomonas sp. JC2975]|uniref:sensor histidine kinase n=1 Tax=Planctomonas sp. JC2975 TaxID=2729626 RepID=UPI003211EB61